MNGIEFIIPFKTFDHQENIYETRNIIDIFDLSSVVKALPRYGSRGPGFNSHNVYFSVLHFRSFN